MVVVVVVFGMACTLLQARKELFGVAAARGLANQEAERGLGDESLRRHGAGSVSYTHLTLPTIYSV